MQSSYKNSIKQLHMTHIDAEVLVLFILFCLFVVCLLVGCCLFVCFFVQVVNNNLNNYNKDVTNNSSVDLAQLNENRTLNDYLQYIHL